MKYENPIEEIIEKYYSSIYRYCLVRLRNESDAYDCTQEVFFMLCKKSSELNLDENIRAWLYRTADNAMKCLRRKKSDLFMEIESLLPKKSKDVPLWKTHFGNVITEEEYRILNDFYINEKSIEDIAKEQDISAAAAYKRIDRIKTKLIDELEKINKITK
ncbi:MAG: sigma-70 family RNA polymerase sigma factor [Firmicutes bacterium]|nr:sigma-70 family RNA polymerase sigma factor [[Eubacterium] siraeum]MCM1488120.1 sigma-70 family RNA polymerase sigma factor [Bacillota bacterium]